MYQHFWSQVAVVQEGAETLPRCDLCRMHMTAGRLIKDLWYHRCNKNTQMRWRRRDVAIASQCIEVIFSLTGEEGAEFIKGVDIFKYLGRPLDRSYDNWLAFLRKTIKV